MDGLHNGLPAIAAGNTDAVLTKAKNVWEVGHKVRIGPLELIVMEHLPQRRPGLARGYLLRTMDGAKRYEWAPYQGLRLVYGTRSKNSRKRDTRVRQVEVAPRPGLWARLQAAFH